MYGIRNRASNTVKPLQVAMDFLSLAQKRFSVRKFSDKPVEQEKLELLFQAARCAPTACNFQPQRILVLRSATALEKLKLCTKYHFGAPLALLVCYDKEKSWKRAFDHDDSGTVDASIVTTHIMLEAAELGLGTTWVGSFDPQVARHELQLTENLVPVAILLLGYPTEDVVPAPGHAKREPIEKMVFYDPF